MNNLTPPLTEHLIIAPIVIPFIAGALMLLYDERSRRAKMAISLVSTVALLFVAVELMTRAREGGLLTGGETGVYLLGNWMAPFGITLVLDRLSAMMLVLVALLAIPCTIYSAAGWHKQGQHYHSLFQFLLMGLNGAFLTGDLFNLFVFFEVMLAASYGLLLHGSGRERVRAGMHYIAINLAASLLFLIGVSMIYGVTGTLNMAHLASIVPSIPEENLPLFRMGASVLAMAFLVKAGIWPLSFWLPGAYGAAAAPVAAMFSIMTKVGIYVLLRLSMLLFGPDAGASAGFGAEVLVVAGMATIIFGLNGVLSSQGLGRMAGHLVLISSGTLIAVNGFALAGGGTQMVAGALYYLVSSTLAMAALFLLIEPMGREDGSIAAMLALTADAYGVDPSELEEEAESTETGYQIPGTLMVLGLSFGACMLVLAGLPPLSGFIGKIAIMGGMFSATGLPQYLVWSFMALLIISGLASIIGLVRIGMQTFWAGAETVPRVFALEFAAVLAFIGMILLITVQAQGVFRYMQVTARGLHQPAGFAASVLGTVPIDPAFAAERPEGPSRPVPRPRPVAEPVPAAAPAATPAQETPATPTAPRGPAIPEGALPDGASRPDPNPAANATPAPAIPEAAAVTPNPANPSEVQP